MVSQLRVCLLMDRVMLSCMGLAPTYLCEWRKSPRIALRTLLTFSSHFCLAFDTDKPFDQAANRKSSLGTRSTANPQLKQLN